MSQPNRIGKRRKVALPGISRDGCFKGCYLLTPEKPSTRTYIGYTVNPLRRLRQHNGLIKGGAKKTDSAGRPWKMEAVVYGFPNNISALRFEWAWQNPKRSTRLRHIDTVKRGVRGQLEVLAEMLRTPTWSRLPLTAHFINRKAADTFTQLGKPPPEHMCIRFGELSPTLIRCANPMCDCSDTSSDWDVNLDELLVDDEVNASQAAQSGNESEAETRRRSPSGDELSADDSDEEARVADEWAGGAGPAATGTATEDCAICYVKIAPGQPWLCCARPPCRNKQRAGSGLSGSAAVDCKMQAHVRCLAEFMLSESQEDGRCLPISGPCPMCERSMLWGELIAGAAKRPAE